MSSHQIKFLKNDFYKELAETLLIRNNKNNFISCYAVLHFFSPLCESIILNCENWHLVGFWFW